MQDDKRELIQAFNDCIAEFPTGKGKRNCALLPRAGCLAVKLGMDEDAFIRTVQEVAPDMGAMDIRRTFRTATNKVDTTTTTTGWQYAGRIARTAGVKKPKTFPNYVRHLIRAGRDITTIDALQALSPQPIAGNRYVQTMQQMAALFPDESAIAYIFQNEPPTPGIPGRSIMAVDKWLNALNPHQPHNAGELIVPNPFTGERGQTADGRPSYIAQTCLAAYPHIVVEFDEMPIETQCKFWAGFVRESKLQLVCLVYSGGKSIHGCIWFGCDDVDAWQRKRDQIARLFAADPDAHFRADVQAMRPRTGIRLAGAMRKSTGRLQRLLWCRRSIAPEQGNQ